jgi:hypothetical protein
MRFFLNTGTDDIRNVMCENGSSSEHDDKIWADGNAPATLIDGDLSPEFYTHGEAVIARSHLPDV